jgi:hypothetical protein
MSAATEFPDDIRPHIDMRCAKDLRKKPLSYTLSACQHVRAGASRRRSLKMLEKLRLTL